MTLIVCTCSHLGADSTVGHTASTAVHSLTGLGSPSLNPPDPVVQKKPNLHQWCKIVSHPVLFLLLT